MKIVVENDGDGEEDGKDDEEGRMGKIEMRRRPLFIGMVVVEGTRQVEVYLDA